MRFIAVLLFTLTIGGCGIITWPDTVETGFEKFTIVGDSLWVTVNGQHFLSPGKIDSVAMGGAFSLLSELGNQVVFEYIHENPAPDAKFLVTVWCKSNGRNNGGAIVAMLKDSHGQTEVGRAHLVAETFDGWEKRELLLQLPPNHTGTAVHFRLENQGDDPVWFDSFKLEFLERVYYPDYSYDETVHIRISEPDMERLREKRLAAFRQGYIDMDKEDWVRAEVEWKGKAVMGSLTFKGDQLYNLEGEKWSVKVEMDEESIRGMKYFSLQDPKLRSFLDEWLFRKMLRQEGVVSSDYRFVPITINGRSLGIYAMEEWLLDEIFVYQDTVNAIGRYKDMGYVKAQVSEDDISPDDTFDDAGITIYNDDYFTDERKKIFKRQLKAFRNSHAQVPQFINKEKAARMLAACDIMEAYGALHWTNIRFISEASSGMVELVGNNGFGVNGAMSFREAPFIAWTQSDTLKESEQWRAMYLNLFNDAEFLRMYLTELKRMSEESYLNVLKLNTINEMTFYQRMLQKEWPDYRFDYSPTYERARNISGKIPEFEKFTSSNAVIYDFEPQ